MRPGELFKTCINKKPLISLGAIRIFLHQTCAFVSARGGSNKYMKILPETDKMLLLKSPSFDRAYFTHLFSLINQKFKPMVFMNTPLHGHSHEHEAISIARHQQNTFTHRKCNFQKRPLGRILNVLFLFAGLFLFGNSSLQAQCSCLPALNIPLDPLSGTAALNPQDFVAGPGCGAFIINLSQSSVSCVNIGSPIPITVTLTGPGGPSSCVTLVTVVDGTPPTIICPNDVQLPCGASTSPGTTGFATAIDNCDWNTPTVISFSDAPVVGVFPDCYSIERTWTATDGSGNFSTCVQTIEIIDSAPPILDFDPVTIGAQPTPPGPVTIQCDDPHPGLPVVSAIDICDSSPDVTLDSFEIGRSGDPFQCDYYNYILRRVWTAIDNCGRTSQASQNITIQDTEAPVFTANSAHLQLPANANCEAQVNLNLRFSVSDNCADTTYLARSFAVVNRVNGMTVRVGNGLDASGIYSTGDYDFNFFATDPCGNSTTFTRRVTIEDNVVPSVICDLFLTTISIPPTGTVTIDPMILDNGSNDNCTPQQDLVFRTNPTTLTCANITGGPIPVWLIVEDLNGNKDSCATIVQAVPSPPAAFCDPITVYLDGTGNYTLTLADLDSIGKQSYDACGSPLTFSASPSSFSCLNIGANTVTLTVTNTYGLNTTCQATVTVLDTLPPAPVCQPFTAQLNENGVINLEGGWLLSGAYELFMTSGTNGSGAGTTTYSATNTGASSLSFTFDWQYQSMDVSAALDSFGYKIGSNPIVWLTNGASLSQSGAGVSVSIPAGATFQFITKTTNNNALAAKVRVFNASPAFTGVLYPGKWSLAQTNSNGKAFISGASIGNFSASIDNCTSPWDLVLSTSIPSFDCTDYGPHSVTVYATDESGNVDSCSTTVTVVDVISPVAECRDYTAALKDTEVEIEPNWLLKGPFSMYLESGTLGGGNSNMDYTVVVKSPITLTFDWSYNSADTAGQEQFGYLKNGLFTILASAGSVTGTSTSVSLTTGDVFGFRLRSDNDLRKAKVSVNNFNINFTGDYDPIRWVRTPKDPTGKAIIHGFVSDNCSDISNITFLISFITSGNFQPRDTFYCDSVGVRTRYISVQDTFGNFYICQSNITILDQDAPVAVCQPSFSVSLPQSGIYNVPTAFTQANSYDNCTAVSVTANPSQLDCSDVGPNIITYTVTDTYGNNASCTTVITIQETTPPTILCPADTVVSCANLPQDTMPASTGFPITTDNCGAVTLSYTDTHISGALANHFTFARTWKATDSAGNMNTCTQIITVVDTVAPVLTPNGVVTHTYNCQPAAAVAPTVSDNCGASVSFSEADSRKDINGNFLYTPDQCAFYNYFLVRQWVAVDSAGNTDSFIDFITVQDTTRPAFVNFPTNITVDNDPNECRAFVNLVLGQNNLTDCAAYANLTITNNSIRGNGLENASGFYNVGTHTITFTVSDPCGNTNTRTVTLIVKDVETPTAICRQGVIVTLNSNGQGNLPVTAINNGSNDNCGIMQLTVSPNQFDCTDLGTQQVILTAVDGAGNIARCTTTVTVVDGSSIAISCPPAITIDCSQNINDLNITGQPIVTSACGAGAVTITDQNISGTSNDCRVVRRTFTVTNGINSVSCTQDITVVDNTVPVLPAPPADTVVNCDAIPPAINLTANDNCRGQFSVTPVVTEIGRSNNPDNCSHYNYLILRTWTATDNCSNSSTTSQLVTVQDTTRPAFSFPTPLIIPTGAGKCDTLINVNLANYISDNCAPFANLDITVDGILGNGIISGTYGVGSYDFDVEAVDPCGNVRTQTLTIEIQDQETPFAICIQNVVVVLNNINQASITPADVNGGSGDNCPGPLTMSVSPNSFNAPGTYQVTLTVTDQAGNTNNCVTNVQVVGGTVFTAGNVVSPVGGMDTIPVTVHNFQNVISWQVSVDVDLPSVATAASIVNVNPLLNSKGLLTATLSGNGFFVAWFDTTTVGTPGITLLDGQELFGLKVNVTGAAGDASDVLVYNTDVGKLISMVPTSTPSTGVDGSITIVSAITNFTLAGNIVTETNVPVQSVNVNLAGSTSGSQVTGVPGTYSFTVPTGSNSIITPSKNINWANGVTVNDALLAHQHVAGITPLNSSYKQLAADANNNGSLTTFDVALIHQLSIGFITAFPNNTSWRFAQPGLVGNPFSQTIASSVTINPVLGNNLSVNFIGIKNGDVNNSANAALRPNDPQSLTTPLEFSIKDISVLNDELVGVVVSANNFTEISGYQFTFQYDQNTLEYVDMAPGQLINFSNGNLNPIRAEEGLLATSWYNLAPVSLPDGTELFTLYFRGKKGTVHISEVLKANDAFIPMEVVLADGALLNNINLVFEKTTNSVDVVKLPFNLYQNVPNPFNESTVIGFTLPDAGAATLSIYDAAGKVIKTVRGNYHSGYHEVTIQQSEFGGSGVYYYRLDTDSDTAVRKMIFIKQ